MQIIDLSEEHEPIYFCCLEEWGMSDALFIDNRQVRTGPPPSYEKIRKKIAKRVKKF